MLGLARWCIAHRRRVVVAWVAVAILTTVVAQAVGPNYVTVFSLPGTESQRAVDLLKREFRTQSGDVDTIVVHVSRGTIDSPAVRRTIMQLLARVRALPHVATVVSPYSPRGAVQVSPNRTTAFATINYDKPANELSNNIGKPILAGVAGVHVPGLQVAAGGQVIENAEGFSVGPATEVGVLAALVILLLTFGSLAAAGMPLVTAGRDCCHRAAWHVRNRSRVHVRARDRVRTRCTARARRLTDAASCTAFAVRAPPRAPPTQPPRQASRVSGARRRRRRGRRFGWLGVAAVE